MNMTEVGAVNFSNYFIYYITNMTYRDQADSCMCQLSDDGLWVPTATHCTARRKLSQEKVEPTSPTHPRVRALASSPALLKLIRAGTPHNKRRTAAYTPTKDINDEHLQYGKTANSAPSDSSSWLFSKPDYSFIDTCMRTALLDTVPEDSPQCAGYFGASSMIESLDETTDYQGAVNLNAHGGNVVDEYAEFVGDRTWASQYPHGSTHYPNPFPSNTAVPAGTDPCLIPSLAIECGKSCLAKQGFYTRSDGKQIGTIYCFRNHILQEFAEALGTAAINGTGYAVDGGSLYDFASLNSMTDKQLTEWAASNVVAVEFEAAANALTNDGAVSKGSYYFASICDPATAIANLSMLRFSELYDQFDYDGNYSIEKFFEA